jgi:hypothetical protein
MTPAEIENALAGFNNGTDNYYKHWLGLVYSDGVKFMADTCEAYWLIDVIASHQPKCRKNMMLRDFQIWTLRHKPTKTYPKQVVIECFADSGLPVSISQKVPFSDFPKIKACNDESFPDAAIKFYVENGVICLPSER